MSENTRNDALYVCIYLGKYATNCVWIYFMPKICKMYVYYTYIIHMSSYISVNWPLTITTCFNIYMYIYIHYIYYILYIYIIYIYIIYTLYYIYIILCIYNVQIYIYITWGRGWMTKASGVGERRKGRGELRRDCHHRVAALFVPTRMQQWYMIYDI